jgi:DNA transformation protein
MFGGYGLYCRGIFFGIVTGERLYFKTDERTRRRYEELGRSPFHANVRQTLWSYYEVPAEVLENRSEVAEWAEEAMSAQLAASGKRLRTAQRAFQG